MESSVCRSEKRRTDCFDERQSVRFYYGFSLLSASEFPQRRNGDVRNNKPPAMRVVQQISYTKKSPFR